VSNNDDFVSKSWLAPIPAAALSLLIALTLRGSTLVGLGSGFFLYLAVAVSGGCLVRWYWARPDIEDPDRTIALRRIAVMHIVIAVAFTTAQMVMGDTEAAVITALAALTLIGTTWPWGWTLRRAQKNRTRPYETTYLVLSLVAGLVLVGVAAQNAYAAFPSGLQPTEERALAGLLLAGALAQFIEAWDEVRRPRQPRTPVPHQIR
jgi:RsiW-degrading membrane proteinase PrsW (M82 family)